MTPLLLILLLAGPPRPAPHNPPFVHHASVRVVSHQGRLYHVRVTKRIVTPPHDERTLIVEHTFAVLELVCSGGTVKEAIVWQGPWDGDDEDEDSMVREGLARSGRK